MGVVALDIGSSALAGVELKTRKERVQVSRARVADLPEGLVHDGEILDQDGLARELRGFWKRSRFTSKRVRLGVANRSVVVRSIDLPIIEEDDERRAALEIKAAEEMPIPLEDAVLDSQPVMRIWDGEGGGVERHMVVAAQRSMIDDLVVTVRSAGLHPVGIDAEAFAILRALVPVPMVIDEGSADAPAQAVCHIGADVVQLVVGVDRQCHFTRLIEGGGAALTRVVGERCEMEWAEAEAAKCMCGFLGDVPDDLDEESVAKVRHAVALGARPLVRELARSLDYYRSLPGARPVERLVISGGGALCTGIDRYLQQGLGVAVEIGDPRSQVDDAGDLDEPTAARVAVALGLALDAPEWS